MSSRTIASPWAVRRLLVVATLAAMVFSTAGSALAQGQPTGLERAAEATLQGLEKSRGKAGSAPGQANRAKGLDSQGDNLTGRERAAAAIGAAVERGNGNGNAVGRGNAADVHEILAGGGIPGQLKTQNHGQAVRAMVHAFNELRKQGG
jgi:hypothetical protein